jgi:hypothetical protein
MRHGQKEIASGLSKLLRNLSSSVADLFAFFATAWPRQDAIKLAQALRFLIPSLTIGSGRRQFFVIEPKQRRDLARVQRMPPMGYDP